MDKTALLAVAKDAADKLFAKKYGMDNFCFVYNDGTVSTMLTGQPCFAAVKRLMSDGSNYWGNDKKDVKGIAYFVFTHNFVGRGTKPTIQNLHYLGWLLNKSPFASLFVTKKPSDAWKTSIIIDADCSPQKVISAAISVRYLYEYPHLINKWVKYSYYMPKNLAYMLLHLTYWKKGDKQFVLAAIDEGHMATRPDCLTQLHLKTFVEGKLNPNDPTKMSDGWRVYHLLENALAPEGGKPIRYPEGEVVERKDPWYGVIHEKGYSISNLRKFVKEFCEMNGLAVA